MRKNVDEISLLMMNSVGDIKDEQIVERINTLSSIDDVGSDGRSVLIHAVLYNRWSIVEWLINNGANFNLKDKQGITALHAAVISSNYPIVKLLLSRGVFVDSKDAYGNTPLFRAKATDISIIALLLENGADCMSKNNFGITPYDTFLAYPEIIELMNKFI